MDGDKVVHLSLREFIDAILPVPRELVSARFPPRRMAEVTEAFADMVENYKGRVWDHERYLHPEDQLAVEFVSGIFIFFVFRGALVWYSLPAHTVLRHRRRSSMRISSGTRWRETLALAIAGASA